MRNQLYTSVLSSLLAAAVAAGLGGCSGDEATGGGKPGGGRPTVAVTVATARVGPIREDAVHVASIEAIERVDLAAKIPGRVAVMEKRLGDRVNAGDLLATIDDSDLRHQLAEAAAAITAAEAAVSEADVELSDAARSLERATKLAGRSVISEAEFDAIKTRHATAETALARARAEVARAKAAAGTLRTQLSYTRIEAPFDAVVASRHVDPGAMVSPGAPLYTLVGTGGVIASFSVPERALGSVTPGTPVNVWVDAYSERGFGFEGTVARVSPVVDAATRTVAVEADLPDSEGLLRAGMFARVRLRVGEKTSALIVPRAAVVRDAGGSGATVYVISDSVARKVTVTLGLQTDDVVEITGEVVGKLSAGDKVVVEGQAALDDGVEVKVVDEVEAPVGVPDDPGDEPDDSGDDGPDEAGDEGVDESGDTPASDEAGSGSPPATAAASEPKT